MSPWRRLIRFLAREELSELFGIYMKAITDHTKAAIQVEAQMKAQAEATAQLIAKIEHGKKLAYAEGELAGRQQAWDCMESVIAERTGGLPDYITQADLAAAKKNGIH